MSRVEYNNIIAYHPGYYVKEMIEELNMTQEELSVRLDTTAKYLSDFINGKAKLSEEMALKLSRVFGTSIELWLNLNNKFIEKSIEIEQKRTIDDECEIARKIDYKFFVNLGILPPRRNICDKVEALQTYFKVATLNVLSRQDFLVQYKTAVASVEDINIINANAWVQTAINLGREIETEPFNEGKLKLYLQEIRSMTVQQPKDFVTRLKNILSECGIALVFMPHLKNCGVNGAVKWLSNEKVILAINDRNKYADYFWFALFHELGHVLQKRKKILIISESSTQLHEKSELMEKLEADANVFAQEVLLDESNYRAFTKRNTISSSDIKAFSKENGIHSGNLVGRLQRDHLIDYNQYNELRVKYEINIKRD